MKYSFPTAAASAAHLAVRRGWLKRLGGELLARVAAASPTEVHTSGDPFIGEIIMIAGSFAPRGYALCQGQLLPVAQNQALFSLLGNFYGGNGTTNFALPNLQGITPSHAGSGSVGVVSNGESQTLTAGQLPAHTHSIQVSEGAATSPNPAGQVRAVATGLNANGEAVAVQPYAAGSQINAQAAPAAIGTAAGSGTTVTLQSPYLVINFCIALVGAYPVRP